MSNEDKFNYSYSAPTESERREIESIKKQYADTPKEVSKIEQLRSLNKKVTRPPMIIALTVGIIGTLILGLGMTLAMEWDRLLWGNFVGIAGIAIAAVAYPLHRALLKRNKRRYGSKIIQLSNELLNNENNKI